MSNSSADPTSERPAARLVLEDGTTYEGRAFGALRPTTGEVVFNTGMVGYPETLTDPSYRGELLTLTYPLIGNYGVNSSDDYLEARFESERIQAAALIVSDYSESYHHWHAGRSLDAWLREHDVPALEGIDTRALTKRLRENGTMLGKLEPVDGSESIEIANPMERNLVAEVSPREAELHGEGAGKKRVVLLDCGAKKNILHSLLNRGVEVLRVPWDHDVAAEEYDGLFLSNGPGDPETCGKAVENIRKALEKKKPTFGICLGHQLLGMAAGASTYKLKYGHRSQNQPVQEIGTDKGFVTSQNHGYAVKTEELNAGWEPWFKNLNDDTNEGIKHRELPFRSVQFHPEAAPGPMDADYLFDWFLNQLK